MPILLSHLSYTLVYSPSATQSISWSTQRNKVLTSCLWQQSIGLCVRCRHDRTMQKYQSFRGTAHAAWPSSWYTLILIAEGIDDVTSQTEQISPALSTVQGHSWHPCAWHQHKKSLTSTIDVFDWMIIRVDYGKRVSIYMYLDISKRSTTLFDDGGRVWVCVSWDCRGRAHELLYTAW